MMNKTKSGFEKLSDLTIRFFASAEKGSRGIPERNIMYRRLLSRAKRACNQDHRKKMALGFSPSAQAKRGRLAMLALALPAMTQTAFADLWEIPYDATSVIPPVALCYDVSVVDNTPVGGISNIVPHPNRIYLDQWGATLANTPLAPFGTSGDQPSISQQTLKTLYLNSTTQELASSFFQGKVDNGESPFALSTRISDSAFLYDVDLPSHISSQKFGQELDALGSTARQTHPVNGAPSYTACVALDTANASLAGFELDDSDWFVNSYESGLATSIARVIGEVPQNLRYMDFTQLSPGNYTAVPYTGTEYTNSGTGGGGNPPTQSDDNDADGFPNAEDPAPDDPCDPDPDSTACLNSGVTTGQGFIQNDIDALRQALNPLFSLFEISNPFEPLIEGDSFTADAQLGYVMSFTDPNQAVQSVELQVRSSCAPNPENIQSLEFMDFYALPFTDSYATKSFSKSPGVAENDFKWFNAWLIRNNIQNPPQDCTDETFIRFNLVDGRQFVYADNTYLITPPASVVRRGIFAYDIDLTLPESTPSFFKAVFKGFDIPFTGIKFGVEPMINFVISLAGDLFSWIFSNVPILQDLESLLAPVAGTPLSYPSSIFGGNFDFKKLNSDPVVLYTKQTPEFYSTVGVIMKFLIFFWFVMMTFDMFLSSHKKPDNDN